MDEPTFDGGDVTLLDSLHRFHDRHAGASHVVFGRADAGGGRSSYDRLFDAVPRDARRILDVACGDGPMLERLERLSPEVVVGFDANAAELAAADHRLGGRVRLVQGLAQSLPFDDAAFDAVTSHMALMLMDEPARVLAELRRVLRPGGTLAFVVGRSAGMADVEVPVWRWLRDRWQVEPHGIAFGRHGWDTREGVAALLAPGFADPVYEPLAALNRVPIDELAAFLERAYYTVDALSIDGKRALAAFVDEQRAALAPDGTIDWTSDMALTSARRPL